MKPEAKINIEGKKYSVRPGITVRTSLSSSRRIPAPISKKYTYVQSFRMLQAKTLNNFPVSSSCGYTIRSPSVNRNIQSISLYWAHPLRTSAGFHLRVFRGGRTNHSFILLSVLFKIGSPSRVLQNSLNNSYRNCPRINLSRRNSRPEYNSFTECLTLYPSAGRCRVLVHHF